MNNIKGKEIVFSPKEILENVRPTPHFPNQLSEVEKIEIISQHFKGIMEALGLDLSNDSLEQTPNRVAKMYVTELFGGLLEENFPKISVIENQMEYDQMIVVRDVTILSLCEHHFVSIDGRAQIAYIPNKRVIGLSKINRIAQYFAKRPQVQERLTKQIADCLSFVLDTNDVAVYIDAKHYCVVTRGVEDVNSTTATCDLRGEFKTDSKTRAEFMNHCRTHRS